MDLRVNHRKPQIEDSLIELRATLRSKTFSQNNISSLSAVVTVILTWREESDAQSGLVA